MAGFCHATLVIEAGEKSGTLITARLATEYNKDVFAVPASIFSKNALGSNWLLKQGAIPVTSGEDILMHWNLISESRGTNSSAGGELRIPEECTDEEKMRLLANALTEKAETLKSDKSRLIRIVAEFFSIYDATTDFIRNGVPIKALEDMKKVAG